MAFETIHFNTGKCVTDLTKLSRRIHRNEPSLRVRLHVTVNASRQTVSFGANPLMDGLISLMQQEGHMLLTHQLCRLDTNLALPSGQ